MATRFLISAKRRPWRSFHRATIFCQRFLTLPCGWSDTQCVNERSRDERNIAARRAQKRRRRSRDCGNKKKASAARKWREDPRNGGNARSRGNSRERGRQSNFFQTFAFRGTPLFLFPVSRVRLVEWRKIGSSRRACTPRVNKNLRLWRPLKTTKT